MAHFAKLDENNIVLEVIVVHNNELKNELGEEIEELGIEFLRKLTGHQKWKQCSYNKNFRHEYPGKDWFYDEDLDVFYHPFLKNNGWVFNTTTFQFDPPIPLPDYPPPLDWNWTWSFETNNWELTYSSLDSEILVSPPTSPPGDPLPNHGWEYDWDSKEWFMIYFPQSGYAESGDLNFDHLGRPKHDSDGNLIIYPY